MTKRPAYEGLKLLNKGMPFPLNEVYVVTYDLLTLIEKLRNLLLDVEPSYYDSKLQESLPKEIMTFLKQEKLIGS